MSTGALPLLVALVGLALALVAGVLWLRSRREADRLRRRLEAASIDLQNLQLSFTRFAPDEVIEQLIATGGEEMGEKKEVTVLFADLVGFTALSESVEPVALVRILNGYFERMSRAVTENRGYVSTFIGDGMLAFFGALAPNPWQGNDAVGAALQMLTALEDYNRELEAQGLPQLAMGVGLHRGEGVMGLIGSRDLKEFAFVGRVVNVAARVQDLTRKHGADIIITETLQRSLAPHFALRSLPPTRVKGVERPLELFAVDGLAES
jgi:adenylate cyclase